MPVNRNALIRYRTIDQCLQNRYRLWTLEDLIEACSEALYEYEGIEKGVSRRTVQMDIQMMRSDKLGYNAPIVVQERKYYTYTDPNYSITNIPLTEQDLFKLNEVVEILKQFKGFSHFRELQGMVQKLEDKVNTARTQQAPIIDFEKNENLKGLEHVDFLYRAIMEKKVLAITYRSFKAHKAATFHFHPYFLKEYRNRWFVLGIRSPDQTLLTLALDRVQAIEERIGEEYIPNRHINIRTHFQDVLGVTVNIGEEPKEVKLFIDYRNAPYVLTKPLHPSQKLLEQSAHGITISLRVQHNFELEREILGFGDSIQVLEPPELKRRVKVKLQNALDQYASELTMGDVQPFIRQVQKTGTAILEDIYIQAEIARILSILERNKKSNARFRQGKDLFAIRQLFKEIPSLKPLVFNRNLMSVLQNGLGEKYFLTKALYFDKPPQSNWFVSWHQDLSIAVPEKMEMAGFYGWTQKADSIGVCPPLRFLKSAYTVRVHLDDTDFYNGALKVIPGSHTQIHDRAQLQAITQSEEPKVCQLSRGSIHVMKPLLLHASAKNQKDQARRVIHLEFNCLDLPGPLEWAEREELDWSHAFKEIENN